MVKKKSTTGRRRKKSNTTTPQNDVAKRSKTEEMNSADYRNGILHGLRVILQKMDDKELLAVMGCVSTMEKKQKSTTLQPSMMTVTATATEESTATATATLNTAEAADPPAAPPTTVEAANLPALAETTTVPNFDQLTSGVFVVPEAYIWRESGYIEQLFCVSWWYTGSQAGCIASRVGVLL